MKIVIALGGNALLRRDQPLEAKLQQENICTAAKHIARLANNNQLIICHGNGPQVGLLALQANSYKKVSPYPLDILDAETQGMIGYVLQRELKNQLPNKEIITILNQVEVDLDDLAFKNPEKFIGPVYSKEESEQLAKKYNWTFKVDANKLRRVVASPEPKKIIETKSIKQLSSSDDTIVICGGGGGIPVAVKSNKLIGIEAVIDKDKTASLIAQQIKADCLLILTDVDAVYRNWQTKDQAAIRKTTTAELSKLDFPAGSMLPKVTAGCDFVKNTGKEAFIGALHNAESILLGDCGTRIVGCE